MEAYIYEVYDRNILLGTFDSITTATIFVKAYFDEYYKEVFSLTIKRVDNATKSLD